MPHIFSLKLKTILLMKNKTSKKTILVKWVIAPCRVWWCKFFVIENFLPFFMCSIFTYTIEEKKHRIFLFLGFLYVFLLLLIVFVLHCLFVWPSYIGTLIPRTFFFSFFFCLLISSLKHTQKKKMNKKANKYLFWKQNSKELWTVTKNSSKIAMKKVYIIIIIDLGR